LTDAVMVDSLLRRVARRLRSAGVIPAERESAWLIEAADGRRWQDIILEGQVAPEAKRRAVSLARRRAEGEPLQYLTGVAGFRLLELNVGPGVFIPRPETELVVDQALAHLPRTGVAVDVGTGSGAIALAIADERPHARVLATESSAAALKWARANRDALSLAVDLYHCDLLSGLPEDLRGRVDVVVSNPPYIASQEANALPPEVLEHEPHEALFAGALGTRSLRRIARLARSWLRPGGWLVLEIGASQDELAGALLDENGYVDRSVHTDYNGRARIAVGRWR
jgi:release factor glutamine methyltransferase